MSRIVGVGAKKKVEKTFTAKELEVAVKKASKEIIAELEAANKKIEELNAELEAVKAELEAANKGSENN